MAPHEMAMIHNDFYRWALRANLLALILHKSRYKDSLLKPIPPTASDCDTGSVCFLRLQALSLEYDLNFERPYPKFSQHIKTARIEHILKKIKSP